jgi:hypothetical protein
MKWIGAILLEIESVLVEINTEVRNKRNKDDEFHKETEYK